MMINKRLIGTVSESKKYIAGNVVLQWFSLAANISMIGAICRLLQRVWAGTTQAGDYKATLVIAAVAVLIRYICTAGASRMSYLSSRAVKKTLREKIYQKLLDLPEKEQGKAQMPANCSIRCEDLHFSYEPEREILHGITMSFPERGFTAIVGESGCGKSTVGHAGEDSGNDALFRSVNALFPSNHGHAPCVGDKEREEKISNKECIIKTLYNHAVIMESRIFAGEAAQEGGFVFDNELVPTNIRWRMAVTEEVLYGNRII